MIAKMLTAISVLALTSLITATTVYAENAKPAPTTSATAPTVGPDTDENMGGMMHECMEKHKDGKMCDHGKMMAQCQKKMGKGECQKMMDQSTKKEEPKK